MASAKHDGERPSKREKHRRLFSVQLNYARCRATLVMAQENLKKAVQMMSGFYQRSDHWMRYADHNHLRVSRIIRSLALLQGEEAAKQFLARIGARVEAARLD